MLAGPNKQFLKLDNFAEPLRDAGVAIESVRFDLAHYDVSLYSQLGIAIPDRVKQAVVKRQAEFLAGRFCAARVLEAAGSKNTEVLSGENRVPTWPVNTIGSISHTSGRAVAAASLDQQSVGLGIDCEMLIRPDVVERIYDTIAQDDDSALMKQGGWSEQWFLTLAFSAKESLYKALYPTVGRFFGFDSAKLLHLQDGEFSIALTRDLNDRWRSGQEFQGRYMLGDEFAVTLLDVKSQ